jgi:hypothetical protein
MKADQGDALAEHAAVCRPAPKWMRLVNDEPVQIPRRVLDRKRSSFACCSEFRQRRIGWRTMSDGFSSGVVSCKPGFNQDTVITLKIRCVFNPSTLSRRLEESL